MHVRTANCAASMAGCVASCAACGSSNASGRRRCGGSARRRGLAAAIPAAGLVWPRVVVPGQFATGEDRHEHRLVRQAGLDQSVSPPYRVEHSGKPPWYVTRMPGGVRGGNREGPPYSILPWAPAVTGVTVL